MNKIRPSGSGHSQNFIWVWNILEGNVLRGKLDDFLWKIYCLSYNAINQSNIVTPLERQLDALKMCVGLLEPLFQYVRCPFLQIFPNLFCWVKEQTHCANVKNVCMAISDYLEL